MAENIKQLSEKDKVRKKISIWLGSSNHNAVIHVLKELIGNSADEINKDIGDTIKIKLNDKNTVIFEDNCNGLPIEGKNEEGKENYKLLFENLFAGTKYDNGITNDNYTVGTNGVFLTVLSRSAEFVEYEVARPNGKVYSVSYHKGDLSSKFKVIGRSDRTYTKIKFKLDDEIFDGNEYDFNEVCEIANEQSSILNGKIVVENTDNEVETFEYQNGVQEFLEKHTSQLTPITNTIDISDKKTHYIKKDGKTDEIKVNCSLQYTQQDDGNMQIEFLNSSNLIHHGTIYDGMVNGLKLVFNRYARENNMYNKKEKQISKEDVLTGLNYVISFKSYFPIYANQTKFASYVEYYKDIMQQIIENYFEAFAIEDKMDMDKIVNKILINKRTREKAETTRANIKKKLESKSNSIFDRVNNFVDCKRKENCELYIVEGLSALGSIKTARNSEFQAVMPIRGKILNCLKSSYDKIFKSDIIVDLMKVIGCGVEIKSKHSDLTTFSKRNLKWDKIIYAVDQDVDGFNIATLLITMNYVLTPQLILDGHIYIVETPLYEITTKNDIFLAYNDKEKNKIIKKLGSKNYKLIRSKGLGENDQDMMSKTAMNPDTRRLTQITMEDAEKAKATFELFLGNDLEGRREVVKDEVKNYVEEVM